jgi:hypothetical protein
MKRKMTGFDTMQGVEPEKDNVTGAPEGAVTEYHSVTALFFVQEKDRNMVKNA